MNTAGGPVRLAPACCLCGEELVDQGPAAVLGKDEVWVCEDCRMEFDSLEDLLIAVARLRTPKKGLTP